MKVAIAFVNSTYFGIHFTENLLHSVVKIVFLNVVKVKMWFVPVLTN